MYICNKAASEECAVREHCYYGKARDYDPVDPETVLPCWTGGIRSKYIPVKEKP